MAPRKKSEESSLDKSPLYKKTMAILALIAGVIGVIAGVRQLRPQAEPVQENTEIVLDGSEGMARDFEGRSKLEAAIEAAGNVLGLVATSDNLALRQFGGPCAADNTRLAVKFAQNNVNRLRESLARISPAGQSTLAHAVIEATGDFNDHQRFDKVSKRIVVITGSDDACLGADALLAIRDRIDSAQRAGFDIQLDFRFIGIGLSPAQKENVSKLATGMKARASFVDHRADLTKALKRAVMMEPVLQDTDAIRTALSAGRVHLNEAVAATGNRDFAGAERAFEGARKESASSDSPFENLGKDQLKLNPKFQPLYEAASNNRRIYDQLISLAETMLAKARSNDVKGYDESRSEFDRLKEEYNRNAKQIDSILEQY